MAVRARAQTDLDLDRRVAAAVEDLARVDALDLTHPRDPSSESDSLGASCRRAAIRELGTNPNRGYFVEVVAGVVAVLAGAVAAGDEVEVVFGAL